MSTCGRRARGWGATFVFAMPLVGDALALRGTGPVDEHALRGLRILAVDDSFDALEPLAALLRFEEAEVIEAHSGAEALEILGREPFDLMISDIGMPKMDGYQLINAIRQRDDVGGLVAIAMSGYGRSRDVQCASEVGFDAHLTKPASLDDCKRLVAQLRGRGRLEPAR